MCNVSMGNRALERKKGGVVFLQKHCLNLCMVLPIFPRRNDGNFPAALRTVIVGYCS